MRGDIRNQINEEIKRINQDLSQNMIFENLQDKCNEIWQKIQADLIHSKFKKEKFDNNSKIQGDPIGEIYEYFMRYRLIWENNQIKIEEKPPNERERGKFYTPFPIIQFIVSQVQGLLRLNLENQENKIKEVILNKIADISCGTGRFLNEWLFQSLSAKNNAICELNGYDTDKKAIELAKTYSEEKIHYINQDSLFCDELMEDSQFDAIIGNPPYIESRAISDDYWDKLRESYQCAYKKFDLSVIFLEKTIKLLRPGGIAGFIVTNKWMASDYGKKIRNMLLTMTEIKLLIDVSMIPIFHKTSTYPVIIIFEKKMQNFIDNSVGNSLILLKVKNMIDFLSLSYENLKTQEDCIEINQDFFLKFPDYVFATSVTKENFSLLQKIWDLPEDKYIKMGDIQCPYDLRKGIHTGNIKEKIFTTNPPMKDHSFKHAITSRQKVDRYKISWQGLWVNYNQTIFNRKEGDYGSLRESWIFEANPKIVIKLFGIRIQAAIDHFQYYTNNSLILLIKKREFSQDTLNFHQHFDSEEQEFYYLLGILNSSLISDYYRIIFTHTHVRGDYLQYYIKDLKNLPIIIPNKENISLIKKISSQAEEITSIFNSNCDIEKCVEIESKMEKNIFKLYY